MIDQSLKSFTIGKNIYKVEPYSPKEAIPFGLKVIKTLGPLLGKLTAKGTAEERISRVIGEAGNLNEEMVDNLLTAAYKRVYTPNNEPMDNEANFNAWFKDHKSELFECGFRAILLLAEDFLPDGLRLPKLG